MVASPPTSDASGVIEAPASPLRSRRRCWPLPVWVAAVLALASVVRVPAIAVPVATPDARELAIDNFAYQLQGYSDGLRLLRKSKFQLLIIDYSYSGGEEGAFGRDLIEKLQLAGPCGRRLVLAYLSIGEAESYRSYFDPAWLDAAGNPDPSTAPRFLGPANPDYRDNYPVRYWLRSWQRILFGVSSGPKKSYLDRIIDAGFDGVYLDIVEAFEFWGPSEIDGNNQNRKAASQMVTLVRRIQRYARKQRGVRSFLVVPQNGTGIIDSSAYPDASDAVAMAERQRRRYFKVIDAIGAEDSFFFGPRDNNNPYRPQRGTLKQLDRFAAAGKTVLAVDYLTRAQKIARFYRLASERGYLAYITRRDLDRLTVASGFVPECAGAAR